jgi:hypothetical protein
MVTFPLSADLAQLLPKHYSLHLSSNRNVVLFMEGVSDMEHVSTLESHDTRGINNGEKTGRSATRSNQGECRCNRCARTEQQ